MPKANSIAEMGLEEFVNTNYSYLEKKFNLMPYNKLIKMFMNPTYTDAEIAVVFSTPTRKITYQTIGNWRKAFVMEDQG